MRSKGVLLACDDFRRRNYRLPRATQIAREGPPLPRLNGQLADTPLMLSKADSKQMEPYRYGLANRWQFCLGIVRYSI
jgi:hypothetical protein